MPDDALGIVEALKSDDLERSYVLMSQYGRNSASELEYIKGLDPQKNLLLVAIEGSRIIGCFCALQADDGLREQTAHVLHVGVHIKKECRGRGIGPQMLAYAIEWAQEKGFNKLQSRIFTTNKRSIDLFTEAGFTQEGIRRQSIRVGNVYIDEILMGKVLERNWVLGKYFYSATSGEV